MSIPATNLLVSTKDIGRDEWLQWRRKGIGGSDAAAILGLDRYRSPFDVYAEKVGLKVEDEDNEAMRQGRDFEAYVATRFEEATGKKVRRRNFIMQHPEHPWLIGNIDRGVVGENAGLECKTTSVLNRTKFDQGEYPPNYYTQAVHYMALTGADWWYIAVLILNKGFYVFEIQRDEAEIRALIEAERRFWEDHVLKQIPPDPDGAEATGDLIKTLHPKARDGEVAPLFGFEEKMSTMLELANRIDELQRQHDTLKQEIQLTMGEAEIGQARGYTAEWRNQTRQSFDTTKFKREQPEIYRQYLKEAQTIRVFKIKEV